MAEGFISLSTCWRKKWIKTSFYWRINIRQKTLVPKAEKWVVQSQGLHLDIESFEWNHFNQQRIGQKAVTVVRSILMSIQAFNDKEQIKKECYHKEWLRNLKQGCKSLKTFHRLHILPRKKVTQVFLLRFTQWTDACGNHELLPREMLWEGGVRIKICESIGGHMKVLALLKYCRGDISYFS